MNKLEKQSTQQRAENKRATPATDVNSEVVRLRHESELLREALSGLVFKIKAECAKGTPLHPEGFSYAIWNRHYPAEFTRARGVLRRLGISHELIEGGEAFQQLWNEYRASEGAQ